MFKFADEHSPKHDKHSDEWRPEPATVLPALSPDIDCCFAVSKGKRSATVPLLNECQQARIRPECGTKCKKILKCNGNPNKVLLFPEESWARGALNCYWTMSPTWWNCNRCKIVEVAGTKRHSAYAKMTEDSGNLYIIGSFKKCPEPDFKLILTANITAADFNMGYCLTGSLERGSHKLNTYQTTHFAVIRRAEFNNS